MDNSEHKEFDSPRYRPTLSRYGYRSYIDLETGRGYTLPFFEKKYSVNGQLLAVSREISGQNIVNNSVSEIADEIIKLIIGVSVGKRGFSRRHGAHAFIMFVNDPFNPKREWSQDIMLDASGSFGMNMYRSRATNLVSPRSQTTISIDRYRRFFLGKEAMSTS